MFSFLQSQNSTASTLFAAYASFTATMMLIRSIINDLIPHHLQSRIYSFLHYFFSPPSSQLTLTIDELAGFTRNQVYDAAERYLGTKISPSTERLKVSKTPRQKNLSIAIEKGEEVQDSFEKIKLKWRFVCSETQNNNSHSSTEKRCFELSFNKRFKDNVLDSYLPFVLEKAKTMKEQEKAVKLYNRDCPYDDEDGGGGGHGWGSINLEHPATFETLAMDSEAKKAIVDDLERFVRRKEFYKKVGKAWKRGYLLYGPPGTGKSSLIAAMANYLKFDVYDLELTSIYSNSELRRVLLSTTNRSILVIEDIDCSAEVQDRQGDNEFHEPPFSKLTLSGILNFIDGLWSSCGDERIIVFTTNHKDRLDPALLRPGRMDMHIHMSYCTVQGFRILVSNYLSISGDGHRLLGEIEGLIESTEVTPAEIAEELMKSDDADVALEGLVKFLHWKKTEGSQSAGTEAEQVIESPEEKILNPARRIGRGYRGRGKGNRGRGRLINRHLFFN